MNYLNDKNKVLEANIFALAIWPSWNSEFTEHDLRLIEDVLWESKKEFPSVSFLVCRINKEYDRKVRIPYTTDYQLLCSEIEAYIQIIMIGDSKKSAYTYALKVRQLILSNIKWGRYHYNCMGKEEDAIDSINWCLCLADEFKAVGKFNFFQYKNEEYWVRELSYLEPNLVDPNKNLKTKGN